MPLRRGWLAIRPVRAAPTEAPHLGAKRPYRASCTAGPGPSSLLFHASIITARRRTSLRQSTALSSLSHFCTSSRLSVPPPTANLPAKTGNTTNNQKSPDPLNPDTISTSQTEKSQAQADWRIIKKLAGNIWPKNSPAVKFRVGGALALLIAGKVLNVQVPFFFKQIVDALNVPITESSTVWVLAGASIAGCKWAAMFGISNPKQRTKMWNAGMSS